MAPWLVKFSVGRKTGRFQFHLEKTFEWPKRWNLTASLGFLLFFASLAPSTSLVGSRIHFLVLFGRLKIRQNRFVIQNIGANKFHSLCYNCFSTDLKEVFIKIWFHDVLAKNAPSRAEMWKRHPRKFKIELWRKMGLSWQIDLIGDPRTKKTG